MIKRVLLAVLCIAVTGLPGASQVNGNVMIDGDLRLFTAISALNVAGFDLEVGNQYHPVRQKVRALEQSLPPEFVNRLKTFYKYHKGEESDESQLQKYISLALVLGNPPDFKVPKEELIPPDARLIKDFAPLMKEFYQKAKISPLWSEVKPDYDAAISRLGPAIREDLVRTNSYVRLSGAPASRTMAIYLELTAPINSISFRTYQDSYYVVLGYSSSPRMDAIRHAYLHFLVDGIVAADYSKLEGGSTLLRLIQKADGVQKEYATDFRLMMTESLIRAMEVRINKTPAAKAREIIDGYYRVGLLLTPYFYVALDNYEAEDAGLRESFADMVTGIQLRDEQDRFEKTFFNIKVPQQADLHMDVPEAPPAPVEDPIHVLLKQGETALNANDNSQAKDIFNKVLATDKENGPALYGLALIAGKEDNTDLARQYFERSVKSENSEPSMRVWAYIYLGRMQDLACEREQAVAFYKQAIQVGDNTRNAQAAAQSGLQKPYGNACE